MRVVFKPAPGCNWWETSGPIQWEWIPTEDRCICRLVALGNSVETASLYTIQELCNFVNNGRMEFVGPMIDIGL